MSIRLFDKTPPGIVCPHFWILNWARGCPYDCSYCYLALTYRVQGKKPHFYPWNQVGKAINHFFKEHLAPELLNTGELADSLMNPKIMKIICHLFWFWWKTRPTHKILLLTKGTNTDFLHDASREGRKYQPFVVASFSVNADTVAATWEKGAPPPLQRLGAAHQLRNAGFETRIRIDPIVPIRHWWIRYKKLIEDMMQSGGEYHTRITLGTPRWFPALPYWLKRAGATDDFFEQFKDNRERCVDGRWRLKNRLEIYQFMISTLREYGYKGPIALCKETVDVWEQLWNLLGMKPEECLCNCVM